MARISKINVNNTEYDLGNQVSSMPTASADELGKVYQYIGSTDSTYTHGYFYECKAGSTSGTYVWENVSVGQGSSGGVTSFNGRTGAVTPQNGDYTAAQVGAIASDGSNASSNVTLDGALTVGSRRASFPVGTNSFVQGIGNRADGTCASAIGQANTASGNQAHAEGYMTTASGNYSHAEGTETTASGNSSHAGGQMTVAGYTAQTAIGYYNDNKSSTLLEVGNGSGSSSRSNALEVHSNGDLNITGDYKKNGVIIDSGAAISSIGSDESGRTTASRAYAKGEHFYKDGKFCEALTAISSGATLTLNTNYKEDTVANVITTLNSQLVNHSCDKNISVYAAEDIIALYNASLISLADIQRNTLEITIFSQNASDTKFNEQTVEFASAIKLLLVKYYVVVPTYTYKGYLHIVPSIGNTAVIENTISSIKRNVVITDSTHLKFTNAYSGASPSSDTAYNKYCWPYEIVGIRA